jgi:hypothetical protein
MNHDEREEIFLTAMQARDASRLAGAAAALGLAPESAHRLQVYRDGFYARVTQTLTDTVFERAAALFGKDYVQGLVGRWLETHPPASPVMTDAVAGLPASLAAEPERGILALGLTRWRVLIGPDPEPLTGALDDPVLIRLSAHAALVVSDAPLFSLWTVTEGEVAARPESVLVYKSSPTDLEMALVPSELVAFAKKLAAGESLAAALAVVPEDAAEELSRLIAHLASTSAFVRAPG